MAKRSRESRLVTVSLSESPQPSSKPLPWVPTTVVSAVLVALSGWVLLAGAAVAGWLAAPDDGLPAALRLGTHLWLLSNGAPITLGGLKVTLIPLGVTIIIVLLASGAVALAARNARLAEHPERAWPLVGLFAAAYAVCVVGATFVVSQTDGLGQALLGSVLIGGGSAVIAVARATGRDLSAWPVWARSIPRAALAALLVMLVGAGSALATGLLLSKDRVVDLHNFLVPGVMGALLLLAISLAYLPNMLLWMASWVLGAGFSVGEGTVVSPSQVDVGVLPSLPVFAAIPPPGPGSWSSLWWLTTGVAAGVLAAVMVVRARPRARFDETALVGGLSGVAAGLLVVGLAWISNGSFGTDRLTVLGARIPVLAVLAPTLLGLSGLLAGLVLGVVRKVEPAPEPDPANEATTLIAPEPTEIVAEETTELSAESEPTAEVDTCPIEAPQEPEADQSQTTP